MSSTGPTGSNACYYRRNKEKEKQRRARWYEANKTRANAQHREWCRQRTYGVSPEAFQQMLDVQEGRCAICYEIFKKTPHVDHDHETQEVRGLLCGLCNLGLGAFRDRPTLLKAAIRYIQELRP